MKNKEITPIIKEIMPLIIMITLGGAILAGALFVRIKTTRELKLHSFRLKMEWFGGGYIAPLQSDAEVWKERYVEGSSCINDPEIIRNVEIWQKEGIKGWTNLTDEECIEILDEIARKNKGIDSQVYKDCYALLYGGYDIFGIGAKEPENGVKNDMMRFSVAVAAICKSGFDVKANWSNLF